jgi:histidinol phosphatase-like enzyme
MCKGTGMAMGNVWGKGNGGVVYNNQAQNGYGSFSQQAANQYNQVMTAYQQGIQNQAQQAMYNQHIAGLGKTRKPKRFMIEGREMDLLEFANTLFPEDCPEKTYILLKFKEE